MAAAAPATSSHVSTPRRWRAPLSDYSLLMQASTDTLPALLAPEPPSIVSIRHPIVSKTSPHTQLTHQRPAQCRPLRLSHITEQARDNTRPHAPRCPVDLGLSDIFSASFTLPSLPLCPLQSEAAPHRYHTYLTTPPCLQILNQNPHRDIHTLPPAGRRSHFRHAMPPRGSPQRVPVLIFYPLPLHLPSSRPNLLPWPKFIPQLSVPPLDTMT